MKEKETLYDSNRKLSYVPLTCWNNFNYFLTFIICSRNEDGLLFFCIFFLAILMGTISRDFLRKSFSTFHTTKEKKSAETRNNVGQRHKEFYEKRRVKKRKNCAKISSQFFSLLAKRSPFSHLNGVRIMKEEENCEFQVPRVTIKRICDFFIFTL